MYSLFYPFLHKWRQNSSPQTWDNESIVPPPSYCIRPVKSKLFISVNQECNSRADDRDWVRRNVTITEIIEMTFF
jgi:hypothetical protein